MGLIMVIDNIPVWVKWAICSLGNFYPRAFPPPRIKVRGIVFSMSLICSPHREFVLLFKLSRGKAQLRRKRV